MRSNDPLGIVEERAANRAKYAWKSYIPPHDRVFRDAPPKLETAAVQPQKPVRIIRCRIRARGATNKHEGPQPDSRGRVSDVLAAAADAFGVTVEEMLSTVRSRRTAYPRFAAIHILHKVLRISLPSIGKAINRDHTTCLSGVRRAAHLRRCDLAFAGRSRLLARDLRRKWAAQ